MKKSVMVALCAMSMLAMVACNDKEDENGGQQGGNTPAVNEGVYNPAQKIVDIKENGGLSEHWTWDGNKLMSMTPYYDGTLDEDNAVTFTYNSNGMITKVAEGDGGFETTVAYNGSNQISSLTVNQDGEMMYAMSPVHGSDGKINKVNLDLSDEFIQMLASQIINGGGMDFKAKAEPVKAVTDNVVASVNLTWNGNNVSRSIVNAVFSGSMSLSELAELPMFAAMLEQYPTVQAALAMLGSTSVPVEITVADTMDYTYEAGTNNPYCGLTTGIADMEFATYLSAALVKSSLENGSVSFNATLPVPGLPLPYVTKTADNETVSFTYTLNAANFPQTCTGSDGSVIEYIYAE